jgi:hypothetical protein
MSNANNAAIESTTTKTESPMTLKITADSHCDHALTAAHKALILSTFKDRTGFFLETIPLGDLPPLPCGLFGPSMGDLPIPESEVHYARRGQRTVESRMVDRAPRVSTRMTVIGGCTTGR